jgi:signal transduction histidine kinase
VAELADAQDLGSCTERCRGSTPLSCTANLDAPEASQLREQFIAVLGHDLRNPLAAISTGIDVMNMLVKDEEALEFLGLMKKSTARMAGLIDDVLDFVRGRLGSGLSVDRAVDPGLKAALEQVVTELQTASPRRTIHREISVDHPISADTARIAQMLSNLLANAVTHGDPDGPIWVRARSQADGFELSVANHGTAIPGHILDSLFQPFARGTARAGQQGLGLGLYIASEIARAHDGSLEVASTDEETRFTFRMAAHRA